MLFAMKWILPLLLFGLSAVYGETACGPRYIDSITYHSQQGATIALIKLSDESVWKWSPDFYSENQLRRWQEGDEITILTDCHPGLRLQNRSHPHYLPHVALTFNSYLLFPSLIEVNKERILLSDGTVWEYVYEFNRRTLRNWELGDRIIPVKGVKENFQLINIDIPYDNQIQIERYIEVEPISPECTLNSQGKGQNP